MFEVDGRPIMADEVEVLHTLREQCRKNGLNVFRDIKPTGSQNVMVTCPFHKQGQERKPSFGVSRGDGKCHCFTCGWVGSFSGMVSVVLYGDYDASKGDRWLLKSFNSFTLESRKSLVLNLSRNPAVTPERTPGFTEQELDRYRYVHPYMRQRGLTDEIIEQFDVGYDPAFRLQSDSAAFPCLTFPVYTRDNFPAFIARRAINSKLFHYPQDVDKPLYAAERIAAGKYSEVIIAESILNALSCWKVGRPAVALLGTGSESQYHILRTLPVRKYIIGTDPDAAGRRAADILRAKLKASHIVTVFDLPAGKDLNDLDEEILNLPEYF